MQVIPIIWDFDLTISKRYQQVPIFRKYFDAIKAAYAKKGITVTKEEDYFELSNRAVDADPGLSYLQFMIWDAKPGGILEGLTSQDLYEAGKNVEAAEGFFEMLEALEKKFAAKAVIRHFFVSVGIGDMIRGFIDQNAISKYVENVAASEFFTNDAGVINGIRRAVLPFNKNEWIIGFMKGSPTLLNKQLLPNEYKYNYSQMIVVGDGYTDTSKFAYAKKKGGVPVAVYKPGDTKAYEKAITTVGVWVDYVLPQDYTPGRKTFAYLCSIIEQKLKHSCMFLPELLHDYKKNKVKHPELKKFVKSHIDSCAQCQLYFDRTFISPDGTIQHSCTIVHKNN